MGLSRQEVHAAGATRMHDEAWWTMIDEMLDSLEHDEPETAKEVPE